MSNKLIIKEIPPEMYKVLRDYLDYHPTGEMHHKDTDEWEMCRYCRAFPGTKQDVIQFLEIVRREELVI